MSPREFQESENEPQVSRGFLEFRLAFLEPPGVHSGAPGASWGSCWDLLGPPGIQGTRYVGRQLLRAGGP